MTEVCCTRAVYDDQAGWWCPIHGDETPFADRHADLDPGELGQMADADYYDRTSGGRRDGRDA